MKLCTRNKIEQKIDARIAEIERTKHWLKDEGKHAIANLKGLKKDFGIKSK